VTLSAAEVAEIMKLVEESSFDELTLEMNGVKLQMRRSARASSASGAPAVSGAPTAPGATAVSDAADGAPSSAPAVAATSTPAAGAAPVGHGGSGSRTREIRAPLLGTFYRAPKPGAAPFVDIGAAVEPDSVIGIIEVMKLMNTVRAGVRGVVTEIVAVDGELVEYGAVLMRVGGAD